MLPRCNTMIHQHWAPNKWIGPWMLCTMTIIHDKLWLLATLQSKAQCRNNIYPSWRTMGKPKILLMHSWWSVEAFIDWYISWITWAREDANASPQFSSWLLVRYVEDMVDGSILKSKSSLNPLAKNMSPQISPIISYEES